MKSIIAILVASFALVACGKKEEVAPAAPVVAAEPATPVAAPAASEPAKK